MKKKELWRPRKKVETVKLPKQATQQIGEKQYAQAMKHMKKFNEYEASRKVYVEPLDPQCTFRPQLSTGFKNRFVKSALNDTKRLEKKPQNRLIQWGQERQRKHIQKVLSSTVEIESKIYKNLTASLEKNKTKISPQKYILPSNPIKESKSATKNYLIDHSLSHKQKSQTTLFTHKKSMSSLFT